MSENQTQAPPPIEPPPPVSPAASAPPPPSDSRARTWNMLCHLSALAGLVGIPFGNILGPLIVWQIKKNEFPSVTLHGKAALNFQITVTLAVFLSAAAGFALSFFCVGYLLIPVAMVFAILGLVFAIIAAVKANNGEAYQYPYTIEFVK